MDRHPERRFKAAYAAFEARRLDEIAKEHPGLRKQQRVEICRKEFERSEENPFNQAGVVGWDANKEEVREKREEVRRAVEGGWVRSLREACVWGGCFGGWRDTVLFERADWV
ncbi:hypothetical protein GJ744_003842 [Endocarpon pusillum]|uniref:Coiled-coil domain-containing protein n=1 Tax=Endocarpon pusillum TaxID=364733 RepID=A0A8H7AP01_9EURO|nr:hypothetical protein GJ744_003842 [Endocarpon pusillum]